jgi:hypothetical protein
MVCKESKQLKMIEFNTMASSFGALADKLSDMHKYVYEKYG